MFKALFTATYRFLIRNKYYSFINILGITICISLFAVISLYVNYEFSYDGFHKNANNTYRVNTNLQRKGQEVQWAITNGYLVDLLQEQIPEVSSATKAQIIQSDFIFSIDGSSFTVPSHTGYYVDSNFLDFFDFKILAGQKISILSRPHSIVITESFANKLFGSTDVIGETITNIAEEEQILTVTGVLKDIPQNSHIQFDFLLSGNSSPLWKVFSDPHKGGFAVYVYFSTRNSVNPDTLQKKINRAASDEFANVEALNFSIEEITHIHFNNENLFDYSRKSSLSFIYIMSCVAFLALAIGCINYILLFTSQSISRVKEIGIRKTQGATTKWLFIQFLGESVLISLLAGIIAIAFTEFVLNSLIDTFFEIRLSLFDSPLFIPAILLVSICTGILAGVFPSFKIISSDVVKALRGKVTSTPKTSVSYKRALVVVQFVFTATMLMSTIIIIRQIDYLHQKNIGYNRDALFNVTWTMNVDSSQWNNFRRMTKQEAQVEHLGSSMFELISDYNSTPVKTYDQVTNDTITTTMQFNVVDDGFIPTAEMEMLEGRNFSSEFSTDTAKVIINQAAKKYLNLDTALQHTIYNKYFFDSKGAEIIGVVNDFHFQSFDQEIKPVILIFRPEWTGNLLIRTNSKNFEIILSRLENLWKETGISSPFEYSFVGDWYANLTEQEDQQRTLMISFTIFAVFVAMLGFVGLVSYTLRTMKKEISIRKVFGASTQSILFTFSFWSLQLIIIAFLVSIPFSIWGLNSWLENFAYRINISIIDYVLAGLVLLLITTTTIILQALNTVNMNPMNALREE